MKNEVKYMETKNIEVVLDNIEESIKLVFKLSNGDVKLNLESDDSDEIKNVFLELIKEIEKNPIELNLIIGKNFDESQHKLFKDAAEEYIVQLRTEIKNLEDDENLKDIRLEMELS